MSEDENSVIVGRYYDELWNKWNLDLGEELLAPEIRFRGSLAVEVKGIEGFKEYMKTVRRAFPDFFNTIEEILTDGDRVVARLTYRGTHLGELFGIAPTGIRVTYAGVALFRIQGGKISDGWVLGDI